VPRKVLRTLLRRGCYFPHFWFFPICRFEFRTFPFPPLKFPAFLQRARDSLIRRMVSWVGFVLPGSYVSLLFCRQGVPVPFSDRGSARYPFFPHWPKAACNLRHGFCLDVASRHFFLMPPGLSGASLIFFFLMLGCHSAFLEELLESRGTKIFCSRSGTTQSGASFLPTVFTSSGCV